MAEATLGARRGGAAAVWLLGVSLFALSGVPLLRRHLHVDEVGAIYSIRLFEHFAQPSLATPAELYLVWLAPLARLCASTATLWLTLRGFYLLLLFGLCVAIASSQRSLPGPFGRAVAFVAVVSFAPLFRHGLEIRHDSFVALGFVALYALAERASREELGSSWFVAAGAMVALLEACSFKAIALLGPGLSLAVWLAGRGRPSAATRRLALASLAGLALGAALGASMLGAAGMLGSYWQDKRYFWQAARAPAYALRQLPLFVLVARQAPLHVALATLAGVAALARARRGLRQARLALPGFAAIALGSVVLNPTLFSYNLIWLSVPILLLAVEGLRVAWRASVRLGSLSVRASLALLTLALASGLSVRGTFEPYRSKSLAGQLRVVEAAEALTSPQEPVADLTGLVAARPPVSKDWLVHSLLMKDYREGRRERLRELIVRAAPPVVVTGQYRFGFLDAADAQAVARYYLPITRELQALGARLPSAGNVELLRSGFYLARGVPPAQSAELGQIDQRVVRDGERLWLARGAHRSQLTEKAGELVWVGPARVLPTPGATDPPLFEAPELPGQL